VKPVHTEHSYYLDPGTNYILAHQTMSRSQEWVKMPLLFKPERWIRGSFDQEAIHPFVSLPFGFGKRMCIGKKLSEMEMASFVIEIIKRFRVGWTGGELQIKSDTLIFPDGELPFTFNRR
jgi:cytochrome P450